MLTDAQVCSGPFLPTLVTHWTVASMTSAEVPKIMTGREHLVVQGEPMIPNLPLPSYGGRFLEDLPSCDQKRLAGNAMETACLTFFLLYAISNLTMEGSDADVGVSTGVVITTPWIGSIRAVHNIFFI